MSIEQRKETLKHILEADTIKKMAEELSQTTQQGELVAQKAFDQLAEEFANDLDQIIEREINS